MAPKKAPAKAKQENSHKPSSDGPSDEQRQQEASKTAKKALEAQQKAKELTQAAAGAGDPEERQRLLNEALQKEMEAGSLGKTASYLTSGSFQGLVAGTGLGTTVGAGLGTLTGALTSGVLSLLTGGVGAGVGALHGPWLKLGDVAGGAVRKITGDIPGWEATPDQQKAIEKMMGQVNDQERPSDEVLSSMRDPSKIKVSPAEGSSGGGTENGKDSTWTEYASSYVPSKDSLPSMPSWSGNKDEGKAQAQVTSKGSAKQGDVEDKERDHKEDEQGDQTRGHGDAEKLKPAPSRQAEGEKKQEEGNHDVSAQRKSTANGADKEPRRPRKLDASADTAPRRSTRSQSTQAPNASSTAKCGRQSGQARNQPRKLDTSSKSKTDQPSPNSEPPKKKPKKLEVRSGK